VRSSPFALTLDGHTIDLAARAIRDVGGVDVPDVVFHVVGGAGGRIAVGGGRNLKVGQNGVTFTGCGVGEARAGFIVRLNVTISGEVRFDAGCGGRPTNATGAGSGGYGTRGEGLGGGNVDGSPSLAPLLAGRAGAGVSGAQGGPAFFVLAEGQISFTANGRIDVRGASSGATGGGGSGGAVLIEDSIEGADDRFLVDGGDGANGRGGRGRVRLNGSPGSLRDGFGDHCPSVFSAGDLNEAVLPAQAFDALPSPADCGRGAACGSFSNRTGEIIRAHEGRALSGTLDDSIVQRVDVDVTGLIATLTPTTVNRYRDFALQNDESIATAFVVYESGATRSFRVVGSGEITAVSPVTDATAVTLAGTTGATLRPIYLKANGDIADDLTELTNQNALALAAHGDELAALVSPSAARRQSRCLKRIPHSASTGVRGRDVAALASAAEQATAAMVARIEASAPPVDPKKPGRPPQARPRVVVLDFTLASAPTTPTTTPTTPTTPVEESAPLNLMLIGGGVTAALGVVGLGVGVVADLESARLHKATGEDLTLSGRDARDAYAASDTNAIVAAALYGTGGLLLAGGVTLVVFGLLAPEEPPPASPAAP